MKVTGAKLYSLSDGRHIVSYFDQIGKRRIQRSFTSSEKAQIFMAHLKSPIKQTSNSNSLKSKSLESAIAYYLEQNPKSYLAQSSKLVRTFVDFFFGYGIARLNESNMREFFAFIRTEFDYSDRSLLVAKSRLQGFFKFLIKQEVIETSPIDSIKFNRGAPFRRKPILFDENQFREVIEKARQHSPAIFYPIFLLIFETAAKACDILELRWKDLNLVKGAIALNRSKELRPREFKMSEQLIAALSTNERIHEFIFTNLEGQPFRKHSLGRELKRFQRQAGLDTTWMPRDLRTSYGVNHIKRGGSVIELQKIMGHSSHYLTQAVFKRYLPADSKIFVPKAVQGSEDVSLSKSEF